MPIADSDPALAAPAAPTRRRLRSDRTSVQEQLPPMTPPPRARRTGPSDATVRGRGAGRGRARGKANRGGLCKQNHGAYLGTIPEENLDAEGHLREHSAPLGPGVANEKTGRREAHPASSREVAPTEGPPGGHQTEPAVAQNLPLLSSQTGHEGVSPSPTPGTPGGAGQNLHTGEDAFSAPEDSDLSEPETPTRGRQKAGRISDAGKAAMDLAFANMSQEIELLSASVGANESELRQLYLAIFLDERLAKISGLPWSTAVAILDAFENPGVQAAPPTSIDGFAYSALQEIYSCFKRLDELVVGLAKDLKRTTGSILGRWKKTYAIPRPQKNAFNTFQAMSKTMRHMSGEQSGLTPSAASVSYSAQKNAGVVDAKVGIYRQVQALDSRCQTEQVREKLFHRTKASLVKLSNEAAEKGIETCFVITGSAPLGDTGMQHFYETPGLDGMYRQYFKLTPDMVCGLARVYATEKIAKPLASEASAAVEEAWSSKQHLAGSAAHLRRTNSNRAKLLQKVLAVESLDPSPERPTDGSSVVITPPSWVPVNSKDTKSYIGEYMGTICKTLNPSSARNDASGWPWKAVNGVLIEAGYYGTGWPASAIFPGEAARGKSKASDGNRDMANGQRVSFCREVRLRPLAFYRANREDLVTGKHPVWVGAAPRLTKEEAQAVKKGKSSGTDAAVWPIAKGRCFYASPNGFVPGFDHGPRFIVKGEDDQLAEAAEISEFQKLVEGEVKRRASSASAESGRERTSGSGPLGAAQVPASCPPPKGGANKLPGEGPLSPSHQGDPSIRHPGYDPKALAGEAAPTVAIPLSPHLPHDATPPSAGRGPPTKSSLPHPSRLGSAELPQPQAAALVKAPPTQPPFDFPLPERPPQPTAIALVPPTGPQPFAPPTAVESNQAAPSSSVPTSSWGAPWASGRAPFCSANQASTGSDTVRTAFPWSINKPGIISPLHAPAVQTSRPPSFPSPRMGDLPGQGPAEPVAFPKSRPQGNALGSARKRPSSSAAIAEARAKRPRTISPGEGGRAVATPNVLRDSATSQPPGTPAPELKNSAPPTAPDAIHPASAALASTPLPSSPATANLPASSTAPVDQSTIRAVLEHLCRTGFAGSSGLSLGAGIGTGGGANLGGGAI